MSNVSESKKYEAHKVYGIDEKFGLKYVYMYTLFESSKGAGGANPLVIIVKKHSDGTYSVINHKEPSDGDEYNRSLKIIFPHKYLVAINQAETVKELRKEIDSQKQYNKFGSIDKNNITSFKIFNLKAEEKEISNKLERDKIIDLVNSVSITKSGIEPVDGIGYGVIIIYSNGEKFTASFMKANNANMMFYSTNDNQTWCNVDNDIYADLQNYYEKN